MMNFILKTKNEVADKMKLVQSLSDIAATAKISKIDEESSINVVDQMYKKLNCRITPIEPNTAKFKFLSNYLNENKGSTHSEHKCLEIFEIERAGEAKKFKKSIGNEHLLWHGSGYYNFGGILSQGLRIAPPEAPCHGYMFGKGVYFADIASKSVNYTNAGASNGVGHLLLCNVALGKTRELHRCDYSANELPKGCSSTHGVG
jgi:poly [ADP-ribose] polymerase 2/3/4